MANRAYIQIMGSETIFDAPLLEDVTVELVSNLASWGEVAPSISSVQRLITLLSGGAGKIGKEPLTMMNMFDLPRWTKTEPAKVQLKLAFYTKTNPEVDVFYPMALLSSLCILSENKDGSFTLPGINAANLSDYLKANGQTTKNKTVSLYHQSLINTFNQTAKLPDESSFENKSKLISLEVPGIVYLQQALVSSVTPTWSKQITQSGYPLWGNIEVQIIGLFPATDKIFRQVQTAINTGYVD